jgi:hypothetical protein
MPCSAVAVVLQWLCCAFLQLLSLLGLGLLALCAAFYGSCPHRTLGRLTRGTPPFRGRCNRPRSLLCALCADIAFVFTPPSPAGRGASRGGGGTKKLL